MWSIGNEIWIIHADSWIARSPVASLAVVRKWGLPEGGTGDDRFHYMPWENAQKCADIVKVAGHNYAGKILCGTP